MGLTLAGSGFEVMAPLLPGHGERYPGMNSCRPEEWLGALRLTFESLHRDGSPVAMVGYCLGGSLALAAARELNPRAGVCLSAPVAPLTNELFPPIAGERDDLLSTDPFITDCLSDTARSWRLASCHRTVTRGFLKSYQDTIKQAAAQLSEIRCPLSFVRGGRSQVVNAAQADQLSLAARNTPITLLVSEDAGHAVPIDFGRRRVARQVADFLVDIENSEKTRF